MTKLFPLLLLFLASNVQAEALSKCITLYSGTVAATTTGSIVSLGGYAAKAMTVSAVATNNSGTDPTLDVKLQTCRTSSTSTCSDIPSAAFSQCTTGCWGGDNIANIDISSNTFQRFRPVITLGGTTPSYNVEVYLCYE